MQNGPHPAKGRRTDVVPPSFQPEHIKCRWLLDLAANEADSDGSTCAQRAGSNVSSQGVFVAAQIGPAFTTMPVSLAMSTRLLVLIVAAVFNC